MKKMSNMENEKNGLIQSQKTLYMKIARINKLFKIHYLTLILLLLFALGFIILWTYLVVIGQITSDLSLRYGLFGAIFTFIQTLILALLIIQIGVQIYFYGLFVIRGNRSIKQVKGEKEKRTVLYSGIVPYINNFYACFTRYSKISKNRKSKESSLSKRVEAFLFLNFISCFYIIFLSSRLLDVQDANVVLGICMVILFLSMIVFWIINLSTSIKIRREVVKWESLFPKLEEWAQELEQISLENSGIYNEEEPP